MKKLLFTFVAAMFFVIGANAILVDRRGTGFVNVKEFDKIYVEANTRLRVIEADTFSIRIDCPNGYEKSRLTYEVSDNSLNIKSDYVNYDNMKSRMFITVTKPKDRNLNIMSGDGYYMRFNKDISK